MNECRKESVSARRAFTLLEVVIVVGTVGVLACVLAPGYARTRPSSNAVQCLNNLRQLALAWQLYPEDTGGKLPPNAYGGQPGEASGFESWAGGWLDYTFSSDNTNILLLIDHNRSPFGAYLGPYISTPVVFKCPSDKSLANFGGGRMVPRVRSVSMNSRIGNNVQPWTTPTAYLLYTNAAALVAPRPSDLFVFTDEREDSINDPVFLVDPDTPDRIVDLPGAYHSGCGSFGWADGHASLHRWADPRTIPPFKVGQLAPLNYLIAGDPDVLWIQQHSAAKP